MIHIHNGVEERYDNEDYVAALFAPNSNTVPSSSTQEHDQQLEEEEEEVRRTEERGKAHAHIIETYPL